MEDYTIEIIETLSKLVVVKADSKEQAIDIVREKYYESEIVLDEEDFYETEFTIHKIWK